LQALRDDVWHVFHFSGHGSFDRNRRSGKLAFVDDSTAGGGTTTRWLDAEELGALLGDTDSLRLAFLNACEGATADAQDVFSSTAGVLVRRGTPAVVAMQHPISDRAAIELARTFYESLATGLAVDSALAEARKAVLLSIPGTLEWGTPVLFMRTADGVLFHVERPTDVRVRGEAPTIEPADHDRGASGASGSDVGAVPHEGGDGRGVVTPVDEPPIVVPPPRHHEDHGSDGGGEGGTGKSSRRRLLALGILVVLLAAAVAVIALTRGGSGGGNGIAVPDVAGRPLGDAEAIVQQAGFRVAGATASDAATPFGVVIRTDPAAGTSEKKGSTVTLVVSTGPPAGSTNPNNNGNRGSTPTDTKSTVVTVTVPDVVRMTRDQATATLQSAGFNVATHFQNGALSQAGLVVAQSPPALTRADRGSTVTIDVATGTLSTVTPARPIP
jgi:hypothetical protein